MNVMIKTLRSPGWHWKPGKPKPQWVEPHASARVDGHTVTVNPHRGWRCTCPDPDCEHPDAVAELIHPHTLALLEGTRVIPRMEKTR